MTSTVTTRFCHSEFARNLKTIDFLGKYVSPNYSKIVSIFTKTLQSREILGKMSKKRVGVIGGGQLAWMMASAAQRIGVDLIVQTPHEFDPAVALATEVIFAPLDDLDATGQLASCCDVITFENEFVDLEALATLAEKGVNFCPSLKTLTPLLDKYDQRSFLQAIGLPVPQFILLENLDQVNSFGFPVVLKFRRHGYDGQGTFICHSQTELETLWHRFNCDSMLLEEYIPFARELAVIAGRNAAGELAIYPVVETQQEQEICRRVIAPAKISSAVNQEITEITRKLLEGIEGVGVFGIELFLTSTEKVFVNEIAPRTHNSGHYTMDGCNISQFEMQLRTVADLPLIEPSLKALSVLMVNLLGLENPVNDYREKRTELSKIPHSFLHWYSKAESRPGRKLGHINVLLDAETNAQDMIDKIETIWYH
jgi:5-(carboxyamino)imidazole ribonucleotide synthase